MMRLDQLKPGDIVTYWHDTGAMGPSICYARIIRLGKVKVLAQSEFDEKPRWVYPGFFNRHAQPYDHVPAKLASPI